MNATSPTAAALHEAATLIANLTANLCPTLASYLSPQALAQALQAAPTHKAHPLAHLTRAAGKLGQGHATQVLANVEISLRACGLDSTGKATTWARQQVAAAASEGNIENAAAMLAELRAFGMLWESGLPALSVRTRGQPTRDFDAEVGAHKVGVEVHCKQLNASQGQALSAFKTTAGGTHFVYPAGQPRPSETTAENVAQKFAQLKPRAPQAMGGATPTLLWLDLQDADWWPLTASHAAPVTVAKQLYFSGGLWHAIYGNKGVPIFEYHSTDQMALSGVPMMAHPGLFSQSPNWAAVVLSFPRETIVFENPMSTMPIQHDDVRAALCKLRWFDLQHSRMSWPPGGAALAGNLIAQDLALLNDLAKVAFYHG